MLQSCKGVPQVRPCSTPVRCVRIILTNLALSLAIAHVACASETAATSAPTETPVQTDTPAQMAMPTQMPPDTQTPILTPTPIPTATPRPTATPGPTSTPTPTPAPAFGSRGNPVPFNQVAVYPDWNISVVSFNRNATSVIAAESQFNNSPVPGHIYVMAQVQLTFTGAGIGSAWFDLDFYTIGNTNLFYDSLTGLVIPDPLNDQPDVLLGGTVVGNVEFIVPANEVNSLLLVATDGGLRFADTIGYFALR